MAGTTRYHWATKAHVRTSTPLCALHVMVFDSNFPWDWSSIATVTLPVSLSLLWDPAVDAHAVDACVQRVTIVGLDLQNVTPQLRVSITSG